MKLVAEEVDNSSERGPWSRSRQLRVAAILFAIALVVRVVFLAAYGWRGVIYDALYDQYMYLDLANSLRNGTGLMLSADRFTATALTPTSIVMPGYPTFLASGLTLMGDSYALVRILQATLGAFTVVFVYRIGALSFGEQVGIIAGAIAAFSPVLIAYTRPFQPETLYTFLLAAAVWLALRVCHVRSWLMAILFGAAIAIGILVRSEMLGLGALLFAYVAIVLLVRNGWWTAFRLVTTAFAVLVIIVTPWLVRNYRIHNTIVFENKGLGLWQQNNLRYLNDTQGPQAAYPEQAALGSPWANMSELARDRALTAMGVAFIRANPSTYLRYGITRVLGSYPIIPREFLPPPIGTRNRPEEIDTSLPAGYLVDFPQYKRLSEQIRVWPFRLMILFTVAGAVLTLYRRPTVASLLMVLLFATNVALSFLVAGIERVRLPIEPYLIILASYAIWAVIPKSWKRRVEAQDSVPALASS